MFLAAAFGSALLLGACRTVTRPQQDPTPDQEITDAAGQEAEQEVDEQEHVLKESDAGQPAPAAPGTVDNRPDRRGRAVRTFFSGGELIREKALVDGIEIQRVRIRGLATIDHGGVRIVAPEIVMDGGVSTV